MSEPTAIGVPVSLLDGLLRYRDRGIETGGFLRAAIENNLHDAVTRADEFSLRAIRPLCLMIAEALPPEARGSRDNVERWLGLSQDERVTILIRFLGRGGDA